MKRIIAAILGTALVGVLAFAGKPITIKGSDTMVILGQRWAEDYMKTHPGTTIQVTRGGSGTGIAAPINGSADIAEASRPMKDKEKQEVKAKRGADVVEIPTALDGIAIYVNEKNPITKITTAQLKSIYQADTKKWTALGGPNAEIVLYSRENNSGTYTYFKEHILKEEDFSVECQTLPGTAAIINAVAKDPNGIGYGGIGYSKGVRVLSVAASDSSGYVEPTEASVASGQYPLARYLYWYCAGAPTGDTKQLVNWVLGDAGQRVVADVGYYPLPKKTGMPEQKAK
ncbi:MAG: PstS family phosphate ABC transporter substrate-binding protein [candidate division Zixibacteria bacterium]|nr:PstS family phosphate ABC transporter substrate-binding protein [candidate division Zixibacteria bacterium]